MITYGYFNSVNGDRTYNADDMSNYFEGIVTDGVFKNVGQGFAVSTGSVSTVVLVGSGKAIIANKWIKSTAVESIQLDASDTTNARYDAIVLRCNLSTRSVSIEVKKGETAANPTKPAIENSTYIREICLAYVLIEAGVKTLPASAIEDTRADESLCGWVQSTINMTTKKYQNNVAISAPNTSTVYIGISEFDPSTDTLFVYINGLLANEVDEYMINGTGSTAYADLAYPLSVGDEITFVVLKAEMI